MQNDLREALDRLKMAAHVYEDDEMAADCATLEALLSARPLALGGQKGDSETLRVLLDNLVIAQTLSKDIRQKATDEARSYLYDLRHTPQPSGETREDDLVEMLSDWFERIPGFQDTGEGTIKGRCPTGFQDVEFDHIALSRDILALLSARPLALGGQHSTATDFPPDDVLACMDDTTPARAEAQDEGAAGEPVGWIDPTDIDHLVDGNPLTTTLMPYETRDATKPLYAHPSPTPAADADRVRIAVEALDALQDLFAHEGECSMERFERIAEMFRKDTGYLVPGKDPGMLSQQPEGDELRRIYDDWFANKIASARRVLAALKSTAAKEGGE